MVKLYYSEEQPQDYIVSLTLGTKFQTWNIVESLNIWGIKMETYLKNRK